MDLIAAYRDVGSNRGAAAICGTTHKPVKRIVEQHQASSGGGAPVQRVLRARSYDEVADLAAEKVRKEEVTSLLCRVLPPRLTRRRFPVPGWSR
jgi:hypothetical protein